MNAKPARKSLQAVRSFIDSNVLIYAEAKDAPLKQKAALTLLKHLHQNALGVISTQVLQEYCNVALKKLRLPAAHIRQQLALHQQFEIVQVTPALIQKALDLNQLRSVSFYDALVVSAAAASGCELLYTEDMNTDEIVEGVSLINPFV
jgi:predicted nucleic acid-binding protein